MKLGDTVTYQKGDKTLKGVIHGVRKAENDKGNEVVIGYLVDTGKDVRVDEYKFDHRDREFSKRVDKLIEKGVSFTDAIAEVEKHKDLPKSKIEIEKIRQPELIDVSPEDVTLV